ncbi:MAG: metallophosphoesterase [Candidatus Peribacteria bacterium]|jgi:predicted MPP superfamily phosphohydrolase|nr:metallophosphoesterase [Candidatus Peribacteria bacterium]
MLVADLHVDDLLQTVHIKELKKQIELQKPDLVLIAGDFFNRANVRQAQYYEVLS